MNPRADRLKARTAIGGLRKVQVSVVLVVNHVSSTQEAITQHRFVWMSCVSAILLSSSSTRDMMPTVIWQHPHNTLAGLRLPDEVTVWDLDSLVVEDKVDASGLVGNTAVHKVEICARIQLSSWEGLSDGLIYRGGKPRQGTTAVKEHWDLYRVGG